MKYLLLAFVCACTFILCAAYPSSNDESSWSSDYRLEHQSYSDDAASRDRASRRACANKFAALAEGYVKMPRMLESDRIKARTSPRAYDKNLDAFLGACVRFKRPFLECLSRCSTPITLKNCVHEDLVFELSH